MLQTRTDASNKRSTLPAVLPFLRNFSNCLQINLILLGHFIPTSLKPFASSKKGTTWIVATGTGSGKTECFILPILQSIFANPSTWSKGHSDLSDECPCQRSVGADCANLLRDCPEVTFGRYTSDTPRTADADEKVNAGAIANERYSREEIWAKPPHTFSSRILR